MQRTNQQHNKIKVFNDKKQTLEVDDFYDNLASSWARRAERRYKKRQRHKFNMNE